jgi:hypothetical protein
LTLLYYSKNVVLLKSDNRWESFFLGGEWNKDNVLPIE